jgi:hypothetical protein
MFKRWLFGGGILWVLAVVGLGCEGDEDVNFSGNVNPELNITGNYEVFQTPLPSLKSFTFVQTGNRIQATDNTGVVYTGVTPGDIDTLVPDSTTGEVIPAITTAITIQGTAGGIVKTIVLTSINFKVTDEAGNTIAFVSGLSGTYSDTSGVNGTLRMSRF